MYNTRFEEHPQSSNKYGTRKKVIDFAKIGERFVLLIKSERSPVEDLSLNR